MVWQKMVFDILLDHLAHDCCNSRGPFNLHGLTLIPAWICNHIHYKVWDEIIYPLLNSCTIEI